MALIHGGDLVGFAEQYGIVPLDFSVNTNPLGLAPSVKAVLSRAADRAGEYPDPLYRKLRSAIAAHERIPMEQIFCGNGAADLIWRLVFAVRPKQALVTAPTFSEYETALDAVGCQTEHHILSADNGFQLDHSILQKITPRTDLVFLCNPNNPTGVTAAQPLLMDILRHCQQCQTVLVVDECFLGFLPAAEAKTMKPQLSQSSNLVILKAFTKLYGMAGFRLGYCLCANPDLLSALQKNGQCWPVSVFAEEAGIAALQDQTYVEAAKGLVSTERTRVRQTMEHLGLRVIPGEANYLLFHTDIPQYHHRMAQKGILIRDCSNYPGLTTGYYRTAIRTPEENDRLLNAMAQIRRDIL